MDELETYKRIVAALQKENEKLVTEAKEYEILRESAIRTFEKERGLHTRKYEQIIDQYEKQIIELKEELKNIEPRYKRQITVLRNQLSAAKALAKWKTVEVAHAGYEDSREISIGVE